MYRMPIGTYSGARQIREALKSIPADKEWMKSRLENELRKLAPNYEFSDGDILTINPGEIKLSLTLPGNSGKLTIGVF